MAEFDSLSETFPPIPDDLTLAQFILDSQHPLRPAQVHGAPWIIEDQTGVTRGLDEVSPFISCAPFIGGGGNLGLNVCVPLSVAWYRKN